jgi:hypothetical protein
MGKKSRRKRTKRQKWGKRAPDDVIAYGPLRIERYGRRIRWSNSSTPEQHAALLKRFREGNREVLRDIELDLGTLQALVSRYDPVELLHRAAYTLLPLFLEYRSENEFPLEESYFLPTVEYLQYLVARTEPGERNRAPTEEEWEAVWNQALKVMRLTESHLILRGTLTDPPTETDRLRFMLDSRRLMIRVQRYPSFFADHLRSRLFPYRRQIEEVYEVSAEEIIDGLGKIEEYQRSGVLERYRDLMNSIELFSEGLRSKGYAVDSGATPEELARTRDAFQAEEFREMHRAVDEMARLTFTPAIFDITDLTTLPQRLLSLLSVKPGESILTTLTGPNHDDLSPLSTSILHYKPFLEADGRFYSFYHSGFQDRIGEIVEADLFQKRPEAISEMANRRADRLEADAADLLSAILCPDFVHRNVFYPNPDAPGDFTELDVLLGVDDILFLVEAKAGGLSAPAERGAPRSMEQDLSDLIIDGQRQAERAERYIMSGPEVSFLDPTGKREICRVRHGVLRRVFRVVVTREDLGWVGARIAALSVLDPSIVKSCPWHVSIDDLRIVAELFEGAAIPFVHYLDARLAASAETALDQHDEIEHVALYNKMNLYSDLSIRGSERMTFDASFMREIDYYFADKAAGEPAVVPKQKMPTRMREFVHALQTSHLSHRFEVGAVVLSMGATARDEFANALESLEVRMAEGRERTIRLPFTVGYGLSVSSADGSNWETELKRSAIQMNQSGCLRWLVVQMSRRSPNSISRIELISSDRFSEAELAPERARHESRVRTEILSEMPGRNERCPCGSGKKFKRCHGSED